MQQPSEPEDELERLRALRRLAILDTPLEARFDRITRLARQFFDVRIALVSLVDADRQWFKSRQGLEACQTPRDISFCGHAILANDVFHIPDACADPRFSDNPLVTGPPNIRLYAGAPLRTRDGFRVGTLCIIDDKPRRLSADQLAQLRDLADCVQDELEHTHLLRVTSEAAQLAMVAERTDNAVIITDAEGRIEWVNHAFEHVTGYTHQEVIGKKPGPLLQGADTDSATVELLRARLRAAEGVETEILNYRKDGRPYWLALSIQPVFEAGRLANFIAVESDITAKRLAERALQEQATRLAVIQDTMVDGLITINEHGKIDSLNQACAKLFGYSEHELVGRSLAILTTPDEGRVLLGKLHSYLLTGEKTILGQNIETQGLRRDGTAITLEIAISEMWLGGERYFIANIRDISERKRLDRMKSEFVSTVSHELRTPLTSIRGALGLTLGRYGAQLPTMVGQMLAMADRNSERLGLLIDDILDLEKIDSGSMEFVFTAIDLTQLAAQAIADNQGYARDRQVRLELANDVDHAPVQGDEKRLMQVLTNLISNAIKFSPSAARVVLSVQRQGDGFRASVHDSGSGVPESFRDRIFQRFAQADSSDSRDKGGTGLGLSISKAIIERHGGDIGYDSRPGDTRFHFDLPAA